jgi:large subunit ribosomal protein L9
MKVILLQKVAGLGEPEDVKEVADGYARNFLFPHHLAVQASPQAVSDLQTKKKKRSKEAEEELYHQEKLAEQLEGMEIEIKQKVTEGGMLYAAVGPQQIAMNLSKRGFEIDKKQIITEPLKEVGEYMVPIKLRHGLEAELRVVINPQIEHA